jgi:hypothetical protein
MELLKLSSQWGSAGGDESWREVMVLLSKTIKVQCTVEFTYLRYVEVETSRRDCDPAFIRLRNQQMITFSLLTVYKNDYCCTRAVP